MIYALCLGAATWTHLAHNSWFALHQPIRMGQHLSPIVFLLFVAFTVPTA